MIMDLQKKTETLSFLKYELKTESCVDDHDFKFIRYSMFNDTDNTESIIEHTHNDTNYLNCEGEYSRVIGISLFNENYDELKSTLISIFKNRRDTNSKGDHYLNKTIVVIIADGVDHLDPIIKKEFESFNLFNSKIIEENYTEKEKKDDSDITFFFQGNLGCTLVEKEENKTENKENKIVNKENKIENSIQSLDILKVVFAVKTKNHKKLHSHLLLFMVFCKNIKPEYVILLDTGTVPDSNGINLLIKAMSEDTQLSGCCGELEIELKYEETKCCNLFSIQNSILEAQWLEYKFSHCLQKTFESSCGFIPVLPGAFCAYRWSALSSKKNYVIKQYLKPFNEPHLLGWTESNIYNLAEDRVILDKISKLDTETTSGSCWSSGHFLAFIRDSKATTEGCISILKLINQRRRWNNGAWFSLNQTLWKTCNTILICRTKHSPIRKLILLFQVNYYILLVSFQWCSVGAYYLAFAMALRKIIAKDYQDYLLPIFEGSYLILTFCLFCISLVLDSKDLNDDKFKNGGKNDGKHKNYTGRLIFNTLAVFYFLTLAFILGVLLYVLIFIGFQNQAYLIVLIIVPCTLIFSLLLYRPSDACKYLKYSLSYVFYIPTYINIIQIYAICKTDDVGWGTRETNETNKNEYNFKFVNFKYKKFFYLIFYVFCNSIFGFLFEKFYANGAGNVLGFLYGTALILILIPFLGEIYYLIMYCFKKAQPSKVNAIPIFVNGPRDSSFI